MHRSRIAFSLATLISAFASSAHANEPTDALWRKAMSAYETEQIETGHIHLETLIERNPGDLALALKCLEKILYEAGLQNDLRLRWQRHLKFIENHWADRAARRLLALERIGAISSGSPSIRESFEIVVENDVRQGRAIGALETIDYFVEKHPFDPFWRIAQARFHRRLDSSKTRDLYANLRDEMDLDHPDPEIRKRWTALFEEMNVDDKTELPPAIEPAPKGSPLALMDPSDPDGEWRTVLGRSPGEIPSVVDRLAAKTLVFEPVVWKDRRGLMDPVRVLDLHLSSQTDAELLPVRRVQATRFRREGKGPFSESETLRVFRRYPWAPGAHAALLELGNRMLWEGRSQAALRCFLDLTSHSIDAKILDGARVGSWLALARIGDGSALDAVLEDEDPDRIVRWLAQPTKSSEVWKQLRAKRKRTPPAAVGPLKDLRPHIVRTPPVSAWSSDSPGGIDLTVRGGQLLVSGRDLLAMYDSNNPTRPIWSHLQRQHVEDQRRTNDHAGYFRPPMDESALYSRWGFHSAPSGIVAIDRATGEPTWSNEVTPKTGQPRRVHVPINDPVLSEGLLYYLRWDARDNVNHNRDRTLRLVCFDPKTREPLWEGIVADSGHGSDSEGTLERTNPATALYGNRVTIHNGSVYSNTNAGIVSRSDIRDGRLEWSHVYRRVPGRPNVKHLGSSPLVVGDKVICMPRDSGRVFALDERTGRLVWENPFVAGLELVGSLGDFVIIRGSGNLVALDAHTGGLRWNRPIDGPVVVGRTLLVGQSVYLARPDRLLRFDARTGYAEEARTWGLAGENVRGFTLAPGNLYIVTDKPEEDSAQLAGQPLNPSMPTDAPRPSHDIERAWTLPRHNARLALPPEGSPLKGAGYVLSAGLLECIEVSARGAIRWRRFIDAHQPSFHFVGKTLLLVDNAGGRYPGTKNRLVAYDGESGRILWRSAIAVAIQETFSFGPTQVFHDGKSRIVAIDVQTGEQTWERDLGLGQMLRLAPDGESMHVFFVTQQRTPTHLVLEAKTGLTRQRRTIEPTLDAIPGNNAKLVENGYYEVRVKPVKARYVRIVALSEVNGGGWASIAELNVIGPDGKNLPRDKWKVTQFDSFEPKSRMNTRPENIFDGDRTSWWHSQWIGGIPPHPHEIQLDLGSEQTVTGLRYLPAVIINDNGMIREYEFFTSKDGKNWGTPAAKGILVHRIRVDRAFVSSKAILFESNDRWIRKPRIYRYALDGEPAKVVFENTRIVHLEEPYFVTTARIENRDHLIAHRIDDPNYRFVLGPTNKLDQNSIEITGDRIVLARRGVLVADLAKKKFIVQPTDDKQPFNRHGHLVRSGADKLLKLVHQGGKGHLGYVFDLTTGKRTEFVLADRVEPFQDRRQPTEHRTLPHFDGVLLLGDSWTISAWVGRSSS